METNALLIGHITLDHNTTPKVSYTGIGGSVYFCSRIFENLGILPYIITPFGKDFDRSVISNTSIYPDNPTQEHTLLFENIYDSRGERTQRVKNENETEIPSLRTIPEILKKNMEIIIVAPLLPQFEISEHTLFFHMFPKSLKVLSPQGFFRKVTTLGTVVRAEWIDEFEIVPLYDFIILSEKDALQSDQKAKVWSTKGPIVIITRAKRGCSVYEKGTRQDIPAFHADLVVDPTGAGDIFVASFSFAYHTSKDLMQSVLFAHAAAALSLRFEKNKLQYGYTDIIAFAKKLERDIRI